MVTPVADGVLDQLEGDTILFSPLFAGEIRGQTCQFKFTLEKVQLTLSNGNLIGVSQDMPCERQACTLKGLISV